MTGFLLLSFFTLFLKISSILNINSPKIDPSYDELKRMRFEYNKNKEVDKEACREFEEVWEEVRTKY